MERKWVIAVVGDIRGFGAWSHRASVTIEIQAPFLKEFYLKMDEYVSCHLDVHFKHLGDGFQIILESEKRDEKEISNFVIDLKKIVNDSLQAVADCEKPTPDGFRIRIFSGFVFKIMALDPNDPERKRRIPEYVGYPINTAHRVLAVNPEIICLCDGNIIPFLEKSGSTLWMCKIKEATFYPIGVDKEDVDGLWVVKL